MPLIDAAGGITRLAATLKGDTQMAQSTKNGAVKKNGNGKNGGTMSEEHLTVPLSAILPSPDKVGPDGKFYPEEEKVAALEKSIRTLGDWTEPIRVVRGKEPGTYHQWMAHTRKFVLEKIHGPSHLVPIIVEDLTPQQMLQRMAEDNGEAYGDTPVTRAEVVAAGVRHFRDNLPRLVEAGIVPAIEKDTPKFYDAASATPYAATTGKKGPHAYTSRMLAPYVYMNDRSVQRTLVVLNGSSRLGLAVAQVGVGKLNRDDSETVGRIMGAMPGDAPLSEKGQKALKSLTVALASTRDGSSVLVKGDGKNIDIAKLTDPDTDAKERARVESKVAEAIRTGKLVVAVGEKIAPTASSDSGNGRSKGAKLRKEQVARIVKMFSGAAENVAAWRIKADEKSRWTAAEVATVREAAEKFIASTKQGAKGAKVANVSGGKVTKGKGAK